MDYYMCLKFCHTNPNDIDEMVLPGAIGNTSQFMDRVRFITNKGKNVALTYSFVSTSPAFMGLDLPDAVSAIKMLEEKGYTEEWFTERGLKK